MLVCDVPWVNWIVILLWIASKDLRLGLLDGCVWEW